MRSVRALALVAVAGSALLAVGLGPIAVAGKAKKVSDPTDTGSVNAPEFYANCDIKKLTSKPKGKLVQVEVTLRGNQSAGLRTTLNVNTKGDKRSDPEFFVAQTGFITKTGGVNQNGSAKKPSFPKGKGAAVKTKQGAKKIQFSVPTKQLGKPRKTGVQAVTCGNGGIDIAPGGNHFDDLFVTGRVGYNYLSVRTG